MKTIAQIFVDFSEKLIFTARKSNLELTCYELTFGNKVVVHTTGMSQKSFIAAQARGDKGFFWICHEMPDY